VGRNQVARREKASRDILTGHRSFVTAAVLIYRAAESPGEILGLLVSD
jgi:hypothetical protein